MSDARTTNEKIAELLLQQTYAERQEMAAWFRDSVADASADDRSLDADWFAGTIETWATSELEAAEDTTK